MRRHAWAWNEGSILTLRNAARVGERAHHPLLCKDCLSCGYALPTPPLDNVVPAKRPGRRYELAHADQFIVQRIELGCPCAHARHSGEPGRGRGRHQRRVELGEEKAVDPPKAECARSTLFLKTGITYDTVGGTHQSGPGCATPWCPASRLVERWRRPRVWGSLPTI